MPRRQPLTLRHLRVGAAALALLLAGCAQVHVDAYPTLAGTDQPCEELLHDLPSTLAGLDGRLVEDSVAGAWGDPPVVLRCGVGTPPAGLACTDVDGQGWLSTPTADGTLLWSTGRPVRVSVEIPQQHRPDRILAAVRPLLDKHDPVRGGSPRCP